MNGPSISGQRRTILRREPVSLMLLMICLILISFINPAPEPQGGILKLRDSDQEGSFEFLDNTAIGTAAVQKAPVKSKFVWKSPSLKPGWYRIKFPATMNFQVIPENLEEIEPFIITVTGPGQDKPEAGTSFAEKVQGASPVSLDKLPAPLLNPTVIQTWRSCQPLWIGKNTNVELEVRRPLIIIGDVILEPVPESGRVRLTLTSAAQYNMFTDNKPVSFTCRLQNYSNEPVKGEVRFQLKDALDGSVKTKIIPVKLKAGGIYSEPVDWKPAYGAYELTGELVNNSGDVLCSQHHYVTYSPFIDSKKLPDSWPIAFHVGAGQPDFMPPVGIKWVRIWGGWEQMEPGRVYTTGRKWMPI